MVRLSAYYPNTPDARFDFDYYTGKHLELFRSRLGDAGIKNVIVERGTNGLGPDVPAPYVCAFHATIEDPVRFAALFQEHAAEIMADVPNFTNVEPVAQFGEVVHDE